MSEKKSGIILTDNPLSNQQRLCLASLLDVIIPPSDDGRMPGAAEMDFYSYLVEQAPDFTALIEAAVSELEALSTKLGDEDFTALDGEQKCTIVDEFAATRSDIFPLLVMQIYVCYYQQDQVLEALGLEARPPFPKGNEVIAGDLSLLDPVRQRSRLYREV